MFLYLYPPACTRKNVGSHWFSITLETKVLTALLGAFACASKKVPII